MLQNTYPSWLNAVENGATTTTLTVTDDEASTGNFDFSANDAKIKGLNISIPEVAEDNTTPITVTLKGVLDTGLTNVILFHKGVPMTSVAKANLVKADGEFYYDAATGKGLQKFVSLFRLYTDGYTYETGKAVIFDEVLYVK